jgi:hypothetical protein
MFNFAENYKIVKCYQGAADSVDCDKINMEQFLHGTFVVVHSGSSDTDLTLALYESDDVAGSNTAAITTAVPLYVDTDMGTSSDTLVAQTSDYDYTINTSDAGDRSQMVVFEVDPAILSAGYPCVYLADTNGDASNTCTILFIGVPRYSGGTLPTAIA